MSPAAAKLLMCVCAGGTGAAVVPAATAIHHRISPRHAVYHPASSVARAIPASLASAIPCAPTLAAAPLGTPQGGLTGLSSGLPGIEGLSPPVQGVSFNENAITPSAIGEALAASSGGPLIGSGGDSGGGGGGGTPINPGGGGGAPPASNAPEPTSWALMIAGFGFAGGAMRFRRVAAA